MEYINRVIDILSSNKNFKGVSLDDFKEIFGIDSSKELTALLKSLNKLENDFIIIRNDQEKYFLLSTLNYFVGTLRKNPRGFGFVDGEDFSVFAPRNEVRKYIDGDKVLAKYHEDKNGEFECEIVKLIAHSLDRVIGTVKIEKKRKYFLSDKDYGKKIVITNYDEFKLVNDTKVVVKINEFGKTLKGEIIEKIGYKYDPGVDITAVLEEFNLEYKFNDKTLEEADNVCDKKYDIKNRKDLRNELIITIDGADSKDLDDAISVKRLDDGFELGVHIADVSYYVEANSALDKTAFERGCSVYLLDRVVPMLPQVLSNGSCSLNPQVDRLAISCVMKINFQGEIEDYDLFESVINSSYRMTYSDVNSIFEGNEKLIEKYQEIHELLTDGLELSKILRNRRRRLGSIDFETKECKFELNKKGKIINIKPRERFEAEKMIEDFMICANECVATHMRNLDLPCVYRIHEKPDVKRMRDFVNAAKIMGFSFSGDVNNVHPKQLQKMLKKAEGSPNFDNLSTMMLRSMQKARYDGMCSGHFGLALDDYLHFTSPIRRYPDLLVHRYLRKYCFNNNYDSEQISKDEIFIDKASLKSSEQERKAIDCEREVEQMKKCEYMKQYVGHFFEGTISSVTKFGFFVMLDNTVEGLVHISTLDKANCIYIESLKEMRNNLTGKVFRLGDKVIIKVKSADKYKKEIDFEYVGDADE